MARIRCSDVGKSYGSTRVISGFDYQSAVFRIDLARRF